VTAREQQQQQCFIYSGHLIHICKENYHNNLGKRYVFEVKPGGQMNLAVSELFPCLLRAKQNKTKGITLFSAWLVSQIYRSTAQLHMSLGNLIVKEKKLE